MLSLQKLKYDFGCGFITAFGKIKKNSSSTISAKYKSDLQASDLVAYV